MEKATYQYFQDWIANVRVLISICRKGGCMFQMVLQKQVMRKRDIESEAWLH